ncbi:MAG: type II/IV secretion system protein [Clostridia bacterium]|nr:type II/IV secretion system protein [Clostridia bacterium]
MKKNFEDELISEGIKGNVSDIHFEPKKDKMIIRFRKDDVLYLKKELSREEQEALTIRLKIRGGMDIGERRLIQKGRFSFENENESYSVRISLMPTIYGEKIVLRILKNQDLNKSFEDLGFTLELEEKIKKIISYPSGLFLFTGSTGSGKTTTQMTLLKLMKNKGKNILIIEEPVEYFLEEANQIEVDRERGFDYGIILRESLRQDPDLIVIGEIRDTETARTAVRAAGTGHLVFATLHTESGKDAIGRLEDLGVSSKELEMVLKGVMSQRLIRKKCKNCKRSNECIVCGGTGYRGRFAVGDVFFFNNGSNFQDFNDIESMKSQVLIKINKGETDFDEFKRKFN